MDYLPIVFAFLMGFLFALIAFNKNGTVAAPIAGAIAVIVFWVIYNVVSVNVLQDQEMSWHNSTLWVEAAITALAAAVIGRNNTREQTVSKKSLWRFIVPVLLLIVAIIL